MTKLNFFTRSNIGYQKYFKNIFRQPLLFIRSDCSAFNGNPQKYTLQPMEKLNSGGDTALTPI